MRFSAILSSLLVALFFSGCFSTGPNESCEDHDRQANTEYLEQNAQKEDVTVTDSGLQYSVIEEGEGPIPTVSDSVKVEFVGRLIDGSIFDTTDDLPNGLQFRVENFKLKGVQEGILLMKKGSTYELVVPSHLGFGVTAAGEICPGTTLIFDLTLIDVFN